MPAGNPLVGAPGSDAIYAWGLRNPWRLSFDRLTGNLVIADPGDNEQAREEIDYLSPAAAARANFGWPEYEGFRLRSLPPRRRGAPGADPRLPPRGRPLRDHRRLRRSRPLGAAALRALRIRGLL
ncbi:MAG: PQQ-dependent sugar dehydrogenase, partial [Solirubrobacterales bacterium]